jgi:hypothetical protein
MTEIKFSERIGITKPKSIVQKDSMDIELRNSLWNVFYAYFLETECKPYTEIDEDYTPFLYKFSYSLYYHFLKKKTTECPDTTRKLISELNYYFSTQVWYEVYNLIEFSIKELGEDLYQEECINEFNRILKRELAGFQFVNGKLIPIISETELNSLNTSIELTKSKGYLGALEHLNTAIQKLALKPKPDFRNSIKESISAVESVCNLINGKDNGTLIEALKEIKSKSKIPIHPALELGLIKIYSYTSDADGIRHSIIDEERCDFEDALFMIVSCSAFINYLISKATKAGVKIL